MSDFNQLFLNTDGKLNRMSYFKRLLAVALIEILVVIALLVIFSDDYGNIGSGGEFLIMAVTIAFQIPYYCLNVRRLRDIGRDETLAYVSAALGVLNSFFDPDPFAMTKIQMLIMLIYFAVDLYILLVPGKADD